jgi:RNA-directed DNA polymerase
LKQRGLELKEEKTRIVKVEKGFDFLGFNIRTYKGKCLIKPQKEKVIEKSWCKSRLLVPETISSLI